MKGLARARLGKARQGKTRNLMSDKERDGVILEAKERRRYALLQAAVAIYGSAGISQTHFVNVNGLSTIRNCSIERAVAEAEEFLREIESREVAEFVKNHDLPI